MYRMDAGFFPNAKTGIFKNFSVCRTMKDDYSRIYSYRP